MRDKERISRAAASSAHRSHSGSLILIFSLITITLYHFLSPISAFISSALEDSAPRGNASNGRHYERSGAAEPLNGRWAFQWRLQPREIAHLMLRSYELMAKIRYFPAMAIKYPPHDPASTSGFHSDHFGLGAQR